MTLTLAIVFASSFAQTKETYLYAEKDTSKLYMDVYIPEVQNEQQACLMFVFGGGFIGGKRDDDQIQQVWRHFTEKGYVVIAMSMAFWKFLSAFNAANSVFPRIPSR